MACFTASQSVRLPVPPLNPPIQIYLAQPERLVYALFDQSRVEVVEPGTFRLHLRPFKFLMLTLEPVADIQVAWAGDRVEIRSDDCWLAGQPALNKRFAFALHGQLIPDTARDTTLSGQADLQVSVDLPGAFRLTPNPLIEKTGNGILKGILMTMRQRLLSRLIADYRTWAKQTATLPVQHR